MTYSTMMKLFAVALFAVLGVALVPACDQLGLGGGGGGGAGGGDPLGGSPCQNACYSDYDAAMNACAKIASDDRKACQDQANAVLTHCMGACDGDPKEKCKQKCDKAMEKCFAKCPKGDGACMDQCNQVYGKCLKDCDN